MSVLHEACANGTYFEIKQLIRSGNYNINEVAPGLIDEATIDCRDGECLCADQEVFGLCRHMLAGLTPFEVYCRRVIDLIKNDAYTFDDLTLIPYFFKKQAEINFGILFELLDKLQLTPDTNDVNNGYFEMLDVIYEHFWEIKQWNGLNREDIEFLCQLIVIKNKLAQDPVSDDDAVRNAFQVACMSLQIKDLMLIELYKKIKNKTFFDFARIFNLYDEYYSDEIITSHQAGTIIKHKKDYEFLINNKSAGPRPKYVYFEEKTKLHQAVIKSYLFLDNRESAKAECSEYLNFFSDSITSITYKGIDYLQQMREFIDLWLSVGFKDNPLELEFVELLGHTFECVGNKKDTFDVVNDFELLYEIVISGLPNNETIQMAKWMLDLLNIITHANKLEPEILHEDWKVYLSSESNRMKVSRYFAGLNDVVMNNDNLIIAPAHIAKFKPKNNKRKCDESTEDNKPEKKARK